MAAWPGILSRRFSTSIGGRHRARRRLGAHAVSELSNADAVLLILTKNWFNSKWCFVEFAQARALGKAIYPLIESPATNSLVSPDIQHLDLIKDREGGLDRLLKGLTQIALNTRGGYEWDPKRPALPGAAGLR